MNGVSVLSDAVAGPGQDLLAFARYVNPLISILTDPKAQTPFTIGIFGSWGSGKSTLLEMLDQKIAADYRNKFLRVHFNPWIYRSEPNLLGPLLHTLRVALEADPARRFQESATKIGSVLLKLGADLVLKSVTASAVSLEDLEKLEQAYLKERGEIESEIRKLRETLQKEVDTIHKAGTSVILFVDDLDRCDPSQIIDLLESVKLFFDLRHTFIVLAVDKEVIDRGIEVKYSKFRFAEGRAAAVGAEYLEKMVQLPLQLFPLHISQVRTFMEKLNPSKIVRDHLPLLETVVLPNPRKIKRILNILTMTGAILDASPELANLSRDMVVRLVVLQVQSGDLYAEFVKCPKLLPALESVYQKKRPIDKEERFLEFEALSKTIWDLSKTYYRPESYLTRLFAGSSFADGKADLATYLSLLGG